MIHLVTGGSGFIGSQLALRLAKAGSQVRILDVVDDPYRPSNVGFVQGSITDRQVVREAMEGVSTVYHCAALVAQSAAGKNYDRVNKDGTAIVAQEAVHAGVSRMLHISTTAVYGMLPDGPITDATVPVPIEDYGRSKLAGEQEMRAICSRADLPLATIRPRVTLGAGRLGIFDILFDWIYEGRKVPVIGTGMQYQQFIHVDDLVDFCFFTLDNKISGTFNVGTHRFGRLKDDLAALFEYASTGSRLLTLPPAPAIAVLGALHSIGASPLGPWHYKTYHKDCFFDTGPLLRLGWLPRYSNIEMLIESFEWYKSERATEKVGLSPHRNVLRQGMLRLFKSLC